MWGSCTSSRMVAATFARVAQARVQVLDYRLAPEHPFPAALDDAVVAYRGLRSENPHATIVIAGDSAGGGLALATMLRLKSEGDILPCAAALFSPLTDLTGAGDSRKTNNQRCAMFYGDQLGRVTPYYAPGVEGEALRNPLISPVYGNYKGFPPFLIHVGEDEIERRTDPRPAGGAKLVAAFGSIHVDRRRQPAAGTSLQKRRAESR